MLNRKAPSHDASGQCLHLYLTGDATCAHCGMKFSLAWQSERGALLRPTLKNLILGLSSGVLMVLAQSGGVSIVGSIFLIGLVLFLTRVVLGGLEMYARHVFVPGPLGPLIKRASYNLIAPKPYMALVGAVKFPMDRETHAQFVEGDTLLVEHLRWSRLPVAIYRGSLPASKR